MVGFECCSSLFLSQFFSSLGVNYNDGGYVTYSGVVKDEAGRNAIVDAIEGIFGAGNVKGDITVNPMRRQRRGSPTLRQHLRTSRSLV